MSLSALNVDRDNFSLVVSAWDGTASTRPMLTYRKPLQVISSGLKAFLPSISNGCSTAESSRFQSIRAKLIPFGDDQNCIRPSRRIIGIGAVRNTWNHNPCFLHSLRVIGTDRCTFIKSAVTSVSDGAKRTSSVFGLNASPTPRSSSRAQPIVPCEFFRQSTQPDFD